MRVFKHSGVQDMCSNHEDQFFSGNTHLSGDSAYTNKKHVITPFKDNGYLTVEDHYFNKKLSSNRVYIECAIGLLKVKWRRLLDMFSMNATELLPFYITACCVLHNLALKPVERYEYPVLIPNLMFHNAGPISPSQESKDAGTDKRNMIKNLLNGD